MVAQDSFEVDLANPESISEKLSEAEAVLEKLQGEFEQKRDELAYWQKLVAWMQALATAAASGQSVVQVTEGHLSRLQALVVGVVNREMRKIRAKDVTEILRAEGHKISGDTVSNTLWYAAEKISPPPIQRAGRGFYAPLGYKDEEISPGEVAASLLAGVGVGVAARSLLKAGGA